MPGRGQHSNDTRDGIGEAQQAMEARLAGTTMAQVVRKLKSAARS